MDITFSIKSGKSRQPALQTPMMNVPGERKRSGGNAPQTPGMAPKILLDSPGAAAYTMTTIRALAQYGYMRNPVVYRAIKVIADTCASIPLKVYTTDGKHQPIDNHPLLDRLKNPNPTQPKSAFLDKVISHWLIAGANYIFGSFPQQSTQVTSVPPSGLYVLPPYYVTPQIDYAKGEIMAYRYDYGTGFTDYPPWKILALKFFHPLDELNGFSPLFAASMAVDRMNEGEKWNISLMQHAARPSGAFIAQGNLPELEFDVLKNEIEEKYSGANRAGVPMLLEGGLQYVAMGLSPLQIDWLNGDQDAGRKIAMAIGVDPLLLMDKQHSTYNNVEQARVALIDSTVIPILMRYCEDINLWMGGYYGGDGELGIDTKYVEMLKHDRQATSIMVVAGWNNGLMGFVQGQTELGLETPTTIPEFYKLGPALFVREDDIPEWLEKQRTDRMAPPPMMGALSGPSNGVGNLIGANPTQELAKNMLAGPKTGAGLEVKPDATGLNGKSYRIWEQLAPFEIKGGVSQYTRIAHEQEAWRQPYYEKMRSALSDYFLSEKQVVVTAIKAARTHNEIQHALQNGRLTALAALPSIFLQTYATIADASAQRVQAQFQGLLTKSVHCTIYRKDALTTVTQYATKHIQDISQATQHALDRTLTVAYKSDDDLGSVMDAVDALYDQFASTRADTIATTEVVAADNMGAYLGAKQTGLPLLKVWCAYLDKKTRHTHQEADGQAVDLDVPFVLGDDADHYLMFPGDTSMGAGPEETINCRCTQTYTLADEIKFNPYHDERGRFADSSSDTGGGGAIVASGDMASLPSETQQKLTDYMTAKGVTMEISVAQGTALMEQAMHQGNFQDAADWYNRAAEAANALAIKNGLTPDQTAGVIAAMSPQSAWDAVSKDGLITKPNLTDAMTIIDAYKANPTITVTQELADALVKAEKVAGFSSLVGTSQPLTRYTPIQQAYLLSSQVRGYPASTAKALRILQGDSPDSALGGPKVRSFYNNIRYPDTSGSATIDTWMAKLLSGPNTSVNDALKTLNGIRGGPLKATGAYPYYQSVIKTIADKYGVMPHQAQAIMWVQGRFNSSGGH